MFYDFKAIEGGWPLFLVVAAPRAWRIGAVLAVSGCRGAPAIPRHCAPNLNDRYRSEAVIGRRPLCADSVEKPGGNREALG